ncbi:Os09g0557300 [Oryza sativa Japonica Group]|uniref:Os09g0557300 protein n=1 Tax=Oryza sativa subsp. japonica TaxID=39947 RepID=Q0IZP9_ORYSJ|nr:Os09g0557300 [Oryza sativa Japonica Group]|eukprot:NP_001063902.2 Os09g0557300 [Oryza sativa Japonica Group]
MATVDRYMWNKTEHLTLRPPCHGGDPLDAHQPLPWILLDVRAYIADRRNATTAAADLGNGHRIEITIFTAPPPQVSYICAWCPTGDPARIFANEPLVGCVNADLVFLRLYSEVVYDLVYRAGGRPSLTLIRDPVDVDAASLQRDYLRSLHNIALLRRALWIWTSIESHHLRQLTNSASTSPPSMAMATGNPHLQRARPWLSWKLPATAARAHQLSNELLCRDIAIVNGLLTIVGLRTFFDSDTDCWSWDLSTWSKPVAHLDNSKDWQKGFMVDSSDITVDATCCNVELLPKLEGRPAMAKLQVALPTLSLTDANVVYVMGKVDASDEKAVVLMVDMANKRLQMVSVYDAERIINDFDYSYTQSTISQYFTTAAVKCNCILDSRLPSYENFLVSARYIKNIHINKVFFLSYSHRAWDEGLGVKGNLKRPLKFHMQYPHKRLGETISRSDNPIDLHEPLQLDTGSGMGTKDETEDSVIPMDLE